MATFERHEGRNLKGIDPDAKDRDLEQYGIWVKAEPQDVLEEPDIGDAALLSETPEGTTVLDESFLTDEEEVFLDAGDESSEGAGEKSEDIFLTTSETPSLQEEELVVPTMEETPTDVQEDLPRIPDMAEFESLDDLGVPIEEFTPEEPLNASARNTDLEEFPEISDFGLEEAEPVLEAGAETDFEALDIDLKFDDTLPPSPEAQGAAVDHSKPSSADGFETVTDFDDFLSGSESGPGVDLEPSESLAAPAASPGPEPKAAPPRAGDEFSLEDIPEMPPAQSIDDMAELERDLAGSGVAAASPRGAADASSDILLKIAGELSSIKDELVSLKAQIAAMKAAGTAPGESPAEAEKAGGGKAGGFFDEEEDETIALTGDELDNILNTAEITEEEASEQAVGEDLSEMAAAAPQAKTEEALESVEELTLEEPAQEAAVEPAMEAESIELGLPDVEEIGLDALEVPAEAPVEQPSEEPLEELQVELGEGESAAPAAAAAAAEPVEELLEPEPAAGGEEELALEVPDEVSGDLEPLEALELEEEAGDQAAAKPLEEVSLDVPELELPGEKTADEEIEELSLEVPADKAGEPEALEEIAPAEEPVEEVEELSAEEPAAAAPGPPAQPLAAPAKTTGTGAIPGGLRDEIKTVLKYMDQLLESLPDDKIEEFANSEYFEVYRRLFEELEIA